MIWKDAGEVETALMSGNCVMYMIAQTVGGDLEPIVYYAEAPGSLMAVVYEEYPGDEFMAELGNDPTNGEPIVVMSDEEFAAYVEEHNCTPWGIIAAYDDGRFAIMQLDIEMALNMPKPPKTRTGPGGLIIG